MYVTLIRESPVCSWTKSDSKSQSQLHFKTTFTESLATLNNLSILSNNDEGSRQE